jgi:hypothetical protein
MWKRVAGDVDDTIVPQLGGIVNLDAVASVEAHVWTSATRVNLSAAVTDSAARTITVELGDETGWLATQAPVVATKWQVEYELTFLDGSVKTWPEGSPDLIEVRPQGDPSA